MRAMPHVWALEKEEAAKALDLLEKALAIDPDYPLALSLAGWCHAQRSVYNWVDDVAESQAKARSLAERAAELSGDDPIILAVLGAIHTFVRNFGTARILLERALDARSQRRMGLAAGSAGSKTIPTGRSEAIGHFERALRLSPLDPMNFNNYVGLASAYQLLEEFDKAVAMFRRGLQERPNAKWIYRNLAPSLPGAGRIDEAQACLCGNAARLSRSARSQSSSRPWFFPQPRSSAWRCISESSGCRSRFRREPALLSCATLAAKAHAFCVLRQCPGERGNVTGVTMMKRMAFARCVRAVCGHRGAGSGAVLDGAD